jgi:hypothetical protein
MNRHTFQYFITALVMGLAVTACDTAIFDTTVEDCGADGGRPTDEPDEVTCYVKFRYDMNMKYADAFYNEVNEVTLYVFDANGNLVWRGSEQGEPLTDSDYRMSVEVVPGTYEMVAWCHNNHDLPTRFTLAGGASPVSRADLACKVERQHDDYGNGFINNDIDGLYHGQLQSVEVKATDDEQEVTISLTKNTNVIRVVLQHLNGEELNKDDFNFTVSDDNGLMDYDNSLLPDEMITYHAWSISSGSTQINGGTSSVSAVVAEITTVRLMETHKPVLTVTRKDGSTVLQIPLIDYILMVKGNYHRQISDQEYLDRQDEYNMTFFLDNNNSWNTNAGIYINSWHVILQSNEM